MEGQISRWDYTVGAEEEKFWGSVKINEALLDPRAMSGNEKIQDRVDIFLETEPWGGSETRQDCTLGTSLRNVFVLQGLSPGKTVVFIETGIEKSVSGPRGLIRNRQHPLVDGVILPIPGPDDSDSTSCDVPEPEMESSELVADDDEHPVRLSRVLDLRQEFWGKPEG